MASSYLGVAFEGHTAVHVLTSTRFKYTIPLPRPRPYPYFLSALCQVVALQNRAVRVRAGHLSVNGTPLLA